jgi:hypothetical protein
MHWGEAGVCAEVGNLVLQGLGSGGAARGVGFEGIDLNAKISNMASGVRVGGLQILHAVNQRLVSGDLVGRVQELRLDLIRQDESRSQGDSGYEGKAGQLLS